MMAIIGKSGVALTSDGSYAGTLEGKEGVRLAVEGLDVDLSRIENVIGSRGDDTVSLSGVLSRTGQVRLGDGDDALHLAEARSFDLRLSGVETVTGVAGATLNLHGSARFETDGSISIHALEHGAKADITFTDLVNDITLALGRDSKSTVSLGSGFTFTRNGDGDLVAVKNGHSLTFDGLTLHNERVQIEVGGEQYSYADLVGSDAVDTVRPTVVGVQASPIMVTDATVGAAKFAVTVTFSEPMLANGSANPVLSFDQNVASSLTLSGGAWNGAHTAYTATYAVADAGVELSSIKIGVSGAKDVALNAQQAYTAQVEFDIDTLNPAVTAFTEDNADDVVSDADNVVAYSVTFGQPVAALTAADLDIAGGTLSAGPVLAGNGLSATFSVTATDDSTSDLVVGLKTTVVDAHGNALVAPTPVTLAVDTVNPTVNSVALQTPSAQFTNSDSLVWRVSFSEAVSQVHAADFSVTGSTATVTDVAAVSAGVYDITVSGGDLAALNGDVTLAFAEAQDIVDAAGNALASTTPSGANQPSYTVDNTAPTVALQGIAGTATGYQFSGTDIATVNGGGLDANAITKAQIDWSKLWIEVDGGTEHDVVFTAADVVSVNSTGGSFGIVLTAEKIAEINGAVDGSSDQIVVDQGFWGDLAGNVQLTGGNYTATADDLTAA